MILSKQRLNISNHVKLSTQQALKAGANKTIILNQLTKETGCRLTLKDLPNLSNRSKSAKQNLEKCVHRVPHKSTHYTIWKSSRDRKKNLIQKLFGLT